MSRSNLLFTASISNLKHLREKFWVWRCSAKPKSLSMAMLKLKTTSSISGVPEPLPEASRSPNQKPWKKSWKTYMHSSGIQKLTCRSSTKFFSAGQKRKEGKKNTAKRNTRPRYHNLKNCKEFSGPFFNQILIRPTNIWNQNCYINKIWASNIFLLTRNIFLS